MKASFNCRETMLKEKAWKTEILRKYWSIILDMSIKVQSYEVFSHPVMLKGDKKIEKLELFFLSLERTGLRIDCKKEKKK